MMYIKVMVAHGLLTQSMTLHKQNITVYIRHLKHIGRHTCILVQAQSDSGPSAKQQEA